MNTTQNKEMASNMFWLDEITRCCQAIDREATQSLNKIQANLQNGLLVNHEFKVNFLKMINYRLMETYKRFEMVLSMERSMNTITFEPINDDDDTLMPLAPSTAQKDDLNLNVIGDTPLHLANDPMNGVDLLNGLLSPVHQGSVQGPSQKDNGNGSHKSPVEVKTTKPSFPPDRREWICFACKEERVRNISTFSFSEIDELYEHWCSQHVNSQYQSRFYSADLIQCNIGKCRYFSTFFGLQKHHKKEHPNGIFVAVRNGQCILCHFDGPNLNEHVCKELEKVFQLKLFNPIRYTENALAAMLQLNRTFECKYCETNFKTSHEYMSHHREQHGEMTIEAVAAETNIVGIVCGCCQTSLDSNMHAQHLKMIVEKRWSTMNKWESWFQQFEMDYLKTKVIFSNGLVVFKQNLLNIEKYGYGRAYKTLARNLFNAQRKN